MPPEEHLIWGGVGISGTSLWQSERGRKALELKRSTLTACELHRGSPEERPLVSLLLGSALTVPGFWLIATYLGGGTAFGLRRLRYEVAFYLFLALGLWLVWRSLAKRNYYLRVVAAGQTRKLVFHGKESLAGIEGFLAEAGARFGFACERRLTRDSVGVSEGNS